MAFSVQCLLLARGPKRKEESRSGKRPLAEENEEQRKLRNGKSGASLCRQRLILDEQISDFLQVADKGFALPMPLLAVWSAED